MCFQTSVISVYLLCACQKRNKTTLYIGLQRFPTETKFGFTWKRYTRISLQSMRFSYKVSGAFFLNPTTIKEFHRPRMTILCVNPWQHLPLLAEVHLPSGAIWVIETLIYYIFLHNIFLIQYLYMDDAITLLLVLLLHIYSFSMLWKWAKLKASFSISVMSCSLWNLRIFF